MLHAERHGPTAPHPHPDVTQVELTEEAPSSGAARIVALVWGFTVLLLLCALLAAGLPALMAWLKVWVG